MPDNASREGRPPRKEVQLPFRFGRRVNSSSSITKIDVTRECSVCVAMLDMSRDQSKAYLLDEHHPRCQACGILLGPAHLENDYGGFCSSHAPKSPHAGPTKSWYE